MTRFVGVCSGGASGPTFRPEGMTTDFAVLAVAGRKDDGTVDVLEQKVIRSDHADRERNMRLFADSAADMATEIVTGGTTKLEGAERHNSSSEATYKPSTALLLDRAAHLRTNDNALASVEKAGAKYIVLRGNRILVKSSATDLALLDNNEIKGFVDGGTEVRKSFLGMLQPEEEPKTAIFGIDLLGDDDDDNDVLLPDNDDDNTSMMSFVDTRTTAPLFVPIENELALHATALAQWQRRTLFCTLCCGPTTFIDGGTCCKCTLCDTKSWPRQDPSMIAVISSRNGQRVLLAHSERHPPKLYTVLAGFVEVGETFEAAVAREAFEETGVRVDEGSVNYVGSQPWPFPQSCMVGFTATADDTVPLNVDEKELVSAKWFDKADVAKAATVEGATMQHAVAEAALQKDPSIPLLIPPKGVIARKLIDLWLDGRKR